MVGEAEFIERALRNSPVLAPVLTRWAMLELPDCWLVAGAVAQTVWNDRFDLPADHGVRDIDIVYFDANDLSEASEARNAARLATLFSDLPVRLDVKNEARVHLWYEARFGYAIEPYQSTRAAIATFPTTATAVGVRPSAAGLEVEATFGLDDLRAGRVRPNKRQVTQAIYEAKVARWQALWPGLGIAAWSEPTGT